MSSLEDIFRRQFELQRDSFGIDLPMPDDRATVEFVDWNITAMVQELAEMRDEIAWKPWAKDRFEWFDRDAVVKEGIDVLHFLVNVWLAVGASPEEVIGRYLAKADVNRDRQEAGYTHDYQKEVGTDGVRRALDEPVYLVGKTMTPDDLRELADQADGSITVVGEFTDDPEPQPEDGPDYHANHAAWRSRHQPQGSVPDEDAVQSSPDTGVEGQT